MSFEYEVYRLDDRYQLCHTGDAIIATDNLAVACSYCYDYYNKYKQPICVWQPRHQTYREHYAEWLTEEEEDDMSKIPKDVTLTKEGGRYYRAMAFRMTIAYLSLPFVTLILLIAFFNPFWFRESMFRVIERTVQKFSNWMSYKQYAIYLGCDPEVWHALKD